MIITGFASKCLGACPDVPNGYQRKKSMDYGLLTSIRYGPPDRFGHCILRVQSACWNLRAVDGCWCVVRPHGWHYRPSLATILPGFRILCGLRTRCSMHYAGNLCFPWSRSGS